MSVFKEIIPPIIYNLVRSSPLRRYGWFGHYETWDDALKNSKGYDQQVILEKVKKALLKVKNGEAAFERDSVVFKTPHYDWTLIAWLNWIAARNQGKLNVLDFGGSLGSTYFQNRKFTEGLTESRWSIVEQSHFVDAGKELFEDGHLKFYHSIEDCLKQGRVNVALLSSVLPYLRNPYEQLLRFEDIEFLIIDKMPLIESSQDRITVQKVPPTIYEASYPAWFFSEKKFRDFLAERYDVIAEEERPVQANVRSVFKAFLLRRKERTA